MNKNRYVWLDGMKVPVSEEVYRAYYRPVWREAKQKEVRDEKECSYDALNDVGFEFADDALVDEIVANKLLLDELYAALDELSDDERTLIDTLYFKEQPAREYAREIDTNHTKINRNHKSIIKKLWNLLKKH